MPETTALIDRLRSRLPQDGLEDRDPRDVTGALTAMVDLAEGRRPGETRVAVFTPTIAENGWTSRRTIVQICTDDVPFLVDSVAAAVAEEGPTVHLLLHPVVAVRRDDEGRLLEVGGLGGRSESWMHLETDRIPTVEQREALRSRILSVVADVHAAVADWSVLRRTCLDIVTALRTSPPPTAAPAEIARSTEFLSWLADDHFTFLGYRAYALDAIDGEDVLRPIDDTGLGILRDAPSRVVHLRPEARATAHEPRILTITKANSRSTVHRPVYLDYIGVRSFDEAGNVTGEHRFLGLFTSITYASSVTALPIVAAKVTEVLAASGHALGSHSAKELEQILEDYPRDELFQDSPEHLLAVATRISRLRERRGAAIFARSDEFGRFVSALVLLPRDRYNTPVRLRIEALLKDAYGVDALEYTAKVGESPLAQLHVVMRMPKDRDIPAIDPADLDARLAAALRTWDSEFVDALHGAYDEETAGTLHARYSAAFPESYKEFATPEEAVGDVQRLERLDDSGGVAVHLYAEGDDETRRFLTVVSVDPRPLAEVLPMLTALGVEVVDDRPHTVTLPDGTRRHISDFGLRLSDAALWGDETRAAQFEEAFLAIWTGAAENDNLNALVVHAGLDWRDIVILRAIGGYLRQIGSAFSTGYIDQALITNPTIAVSLVHLFAASFDPDAADPDAQARIRERVLQGLDGVASLDHDRILRAFLGVIDATLRTNFYQQSADGQPKPWVSMKLDSKRVPDLPAPRPMVEIWVYSPEVEGVHLRFGAVARGGLRWSDRREDFRTEVLGLVKAQMVKNAVIVPTGSKGGFVGKRLPDSAADRGAWLEAGKAAYRTFIRGLLDLTDNRTADGILPPDRVVRRDGDDPYLVVAADKGTATFSDIANGISQEYGFWLDDAFASGGSVGYDHKAMGITARGAWESVKRHFRELGHDTQTEDFTVVGIGDMSGDVFGNGMLLSEHIRLIAAFDHRHVFIDPDPDPAVSFAERLRLFRLPGSSWGDYDPALISAGGGAFPLSAKSIPVSPQMRAALGLDDAVTALTPNELKRAVLLAPVDLLWNGGIGTYVKASTESHAEIGDRANDAIRVDGRSLRVRVVGEGGNLGVSQRGRIEAAHAGVQINTDAIDNSAGVGTSDREVNIKILLGALVREGMLSIEDRNALLASMTDEVAVQVLRDNYEQNVLLGNSRANAAIMLPVHERLMETLEARDELDREIEFLPDRLTVQERVEAGEGLTRPEFAVLVAYAKLALKTDLAATDLADDPWFAETLAEYFPSALRERFGERLAEHPLRHEIIVNTVVNSMVNRGGITFADRAAAETGATAEQIARAYVAAREIFDLRGFVVAVEATDNLVDTATQTRLYLDFRRLLDRAARWFVQHRSEGVDIGAEIARFAEPVRILSERLAGFFHGDEAAQFAARQAALAAAGVPEDLAHRGARLLEALRLLDVIELAQARGWDLEDVARTYFLLSGEIRFDDLLTSVSGLPQDDSWQSMARASLRDDLYAVLVDLTASVQTHAGDVELDERYARWLEGGGSTAQRAASALAAASAVPNPGIAVLSVALRRLRSLVR
ncbi:NAD-glutamate dehydrogenase [Microbacterium sp. 22303]|uniref:NAD-glutamate dehydrogenase n=1 Tax=Microbacterium sp. 22303 TaxID=3453905 RepID=UPI003F870798